MLLQRRRRSGGLVGALIIVLYSYRRHSLSAYQEAIFVFSARFETDLGGITAFLFV